jgi:hypothetical protein
MRDWLIEIIFWAAILAYPVLWLAAIMGLSDIIQNLQRKPTIPPVPETLEQTIERARRRAAGRRFIEAAAARTGSAPQ